MGAAGLGVALSASHSGGPVGEMSLSAGTIFAKKWNLDP